VLRAARALLRLEQSALAHAAGVSLETIKRLERIRGVVKVHARTLKALEDALAAHGLLVEPEPDGSIAVLWRQASPPVKVTIAPAGPPEPGHLVRLIYFSTATDQGGLAGIIEEIEKVSLGRNLRLGISGCLAAIQGRFMQALEGDPAAVQEVYASICADPRHYGLVVVENRAISHRRFGDWAMCARLSGAEELAKADPTQAQGFRPEQLSPAACLGVLAWLSDLEARDLEQMG
jgi:transcriptional regulator with XRE-family HTH domain